jgi:trans-2,3-dihydro-3-hydroxyanthranilate isomerase
MKNLKFYIVDVFAERKFSGNQLAVFRNADVLSDEEMQILAREMNYSESTFILEEEREDGGFPVRIFTPEEEVPFAGHPTLGTAFVIQQKILNSQVEKLHLSLKVGEIPVKFFYTDNRPDILWMEQKQPSFGEELDPAEVANLLSIQKSVLDDRFPVQEISTGLPFFIVPVKDLNSIRKTQVNRTPFFAFIKHREAKAFLLFCPETYETGHHLNVRVYVDYFGIPEDPATGSANGCLAAYLLQHRYFGKESIDITVEQGYEINRHSLLYLRAEKKEDRFRIQVGGKVQMVAEGNLL